MSSGMAASSTKTTKKPTGAAKDKDIVSRLADAGEEALHRLADLPGGNRALGALNDLRNRVDELGKKVRGIDELEKRLAKVEKELATLKKASPRRTTTRKSS